MSYAYDAASRVTSYSGPEGAIQYSYDATGQLTGASGAVNENFTYDPAGNRTGSGYQTGPANRLLSDGTYNYTYDAEGNLIEKTEIATGKTWTFTWDQRNRLTHITVTDGQGIVVSEAEYTYDVFDRLIGRVLDRDGAGPQAPEEFWTLYDTPATAAEIAAAIYEPGTLLSNPWADVKQGSLTSRYLYTRVIDEVLARLEDDQGIEDLAWYLADRLGSVRQQVQADGTILNEINYDSFGNIVTETNPSEGDRFKYTGREYDDLTGLYYYRARWYDATTGKFISEDPLGFAAGDYNITRYVNNNPINAIDITGLYKITFDRNVDPLLRQRIKNSLQRLKGIVRQRLEEVSREIREIEQLLEKRRAKIPPGMCLYAPDAENLMKDLRYLRRILQNILEGLNSTSEAIHFRTTKTGRGPAYTRQWLWGSSTININLAFSLWSRPESKVTRRQIDITLLHELSHIYGTEDNVYKEELVKTEGGVKTVVKSGTFFREAEHIGQLAQYGLRQRFDSPAFPDWIHYRRKCLEKWDWREPGLRRPSFPDPFGFPWLQTP